MERRVLPAGTQRGRRARDARGGPALRVSGCAALWVLLLAQVAVQVSPRWWGREAPRLPSRCPGLTELWPLFQEAPACSVGPAAASPGSSSVWRPPGSADWMEKGGKSAGKGVPSLHQVALDYRVLRMFLTLRTHSQDAPCSLAL